MRKRWDAPRYVRLGGRLGLLLFIVVTALGTAMGKSARQAPAKAAWTLMIYMDADNSLETPQLANVEQLLKIGSSDAVQIVMLCDRSPQSEPKDQYTDAAIGGLPSWSGAKLLRVEKGKLKVLADWGDTNMADSATMRKFLDTAAKSYPADHYGLIIADHGSGWEALCVDESSGDKLMNLRDLRAGLEPFVAAHGKLDLVGLDACLMASFETAQALAPVTHFMVASEELAPGRGWNYDAVAKALIEKPALTHQDLGRVIVDTYSNQFKESKDPMAKFEGMGTTLSVLNLDTFPALQTAVSALADRCIDSLHHGRPGWIKVARPRAVSEEFGANGARGGGGEEEMHDLMHLAQTMEASDEPMLREAAQRVDDAIRQVVAYGMHGICCPHAGGISIYFPIDGIRLNDATGSAYFSRTFSRDCRWVNFLSLYSVAVDDFAVKPKLAPLKATGKTASLQKPIEILSKVTEGDIDRVHFLMLAHDKEDLLILGRLPTRALPDGTLGQRFNGLWFHLTNSKQGVTCPVTDFEALDDKGNTYLAYVPAKIKRDGSNKWTEVLCTFYVSTSNGAPSGQLLHAFAETPQGPLQVALRSGDSICPVYTRLTADGAVKDWSGNASIQITDPADFKMGWGLIGKGAYQLGFEVINLAGLPDVELADFFLE